MDEMSMCANFFWNRPSRLGGDSEQTDTQTDNGIYNIEVAINKTHSPFYDH